MVRQKARLTLQIANSDVSKENETEIAASAVEVEVATITAQFSAVVGPWRPKAHGQQRSLTVATQARREQDSHFVAHDGIT